MRLDVARSLAQTFDYGAQKLAIRLYRESSVCRLPQLRGSVDVSVACPAATRSVAKSPSGPYRRGMGSRDDRVSDVE